MTQIIPGLTTVYRVLFRGRVIAETDSDHTARAAALLAENFGDRPRNTIQGDE